MFPGTHVIVEIILRTVVIYLVVLIGVRLSGKREVGQMTPFDLTLLLLISNAVQNAMTGPGHLSGGRDCGRLDSTAAQLPGGRSFGREPAFPQIRPGPAQPAGSRWPGHRSAHGQGTRQHG